MSVNQKGEPIREETLFDGFHMATGLERDEAIALLCQHLKVSIVRTNDTKHGGSEMVLRQADD